ncbi:MAG: hypothetical protein ACYDFT_02185, partial [Thermoplasmata archaeon]
PLGSPWDVPGAANVFCLGTRFAGTQWLSGPGAGPEATASGLLSDLVGLMGGALRPRSPPGPGLPVLPDPPPLRREEVPAHGA